MIIPELSEKYIDFIGFYENVLPQGFCQHIIHEFDKVFDMGLCGTRKDENAKKYHKNDSFYFLDIINHDNVIGKFDNYDVRFILHKGLQNKKICHDLFSEVV